MTGAAAAAGWYLAIGVVIALAGLVRLLLGRDLVARLIALNVTGIGSLIILLALGAREEPTDPVLSALVITGLVITVAFTGLGAVLIRRIEGVEDAEAGATEAAEVESAPPDITPPGRTPPERARPERHPRAQGPS